MKYRHTLKKLKQQIDEAVRSAPLGIKPPEFGWFWEGNEPSAEWEAQHRDYDAAMLRRGIDTSKMTTGVFLEVVEAPKRNLVWPGDDHRYVK